MTSDDERGEQRALEQVCVFVCMHVCVRVRQSEREGLVVFGRHCVRFILKKRQQKQQQQPQER